MFDTKICFTKWPSACQKKDKNTFVTYITDDRITLNYGRISYCCSPTRVIMFVLFSVPIQVVDW